MQLPYQKNRDTLLKVSHTNFSPEERELESTHDFFWCVSRKKEVAAKKIGLDYYPMGYQLRKFSDGHDHRYGFQGEYAEDETESIGYNTFQLRFYDPVIGRWLSTDPKNVGFSPYAGMGNQYSFSMDPDGGEPITIGLAIVIGAAISATTYTVGVLNTSGGWQNFNAGDFFTQTAIGGISGAVGGGVGSAVSSGIGTSVGLGFFKGAVVGAAGGFAGGFTSGALSSWAVNKPVGQVLSSALKGGAIGAAAGGVIGGVTTGIQAVKHGGNFWSGKGVRSAMLASSSDNSSTSDDRISYNTEEAEKFAEKYFKGLDYYEDVTIYGDGSTGGTDHVNYKDPKGAFIDKATGDRVLGVAYFRGKGNFEIYLSKAAYTSKRQMYMVLGHEIMHTGFYSKSLFWGEAHHYAILKWEKAVSRSWANFNKALIEYHQQIYTLDPSDAVKKIFNPAKVGFDVNNIPWISR